MPLHKECTNLLLLVLLGLTQMLQHLPLHLPQQLHQQNQVRQNPAVLFLTQAQAESLSLRPELQLLPQHGEESEVPRLKMPETGDKVSGA